MTAERRNGNIKEDYDASPFSQSNVFSPKSATIKEVDEDEEKPSASPFQGANVVKERPIQTFDAVLFATDNDFLESSRIRSIFKQNAMKEFTGVEVAESPVIIIVEDNPACEFCYPSPATLNRATPLMRTFHRTKCYIAAFLLILAMFFFTLRDNSNKSSAPTTTNTKP
ncbi:hypothetical protein BC829DRAFT_407161 [Chytridium lagenaria]|nr:hypothetical protein BC829DRAFT_407161 [Chytridium lagenaria]